MTKKTAVPVLTRPDAGTQRMKVLKTIARAGKRGLTDAETASRLGMIESSIRHRRHELVEDGWVVDSGKKRVFDDRRESTVWTLTEVGRSQL